MGDVNKFKKKQKGTKTMANLPGSIKNLNTLLGEQLLDGGGSGGGGGSSDFSTAQVKVTRAQLKTVCMSFMIDGEYASMQSFVMDSGEYTAVLYKGVCVATALNLEDRFVDPTITVTGNATVDGPMIIITGDCTITIS